MFRVYSMFSQIPEHWTPRIAGMALACYKHLVRGSAGMCTRPCFKKEGSVVTEAGDDEVCWDRNLYLGRPLPRGLEAAALEPEQNQHMEPAVDAPFLLRPAEAAAETQGS